MLTHDNSANFIYRGHGGSRDLIRRRVLSLRYVFDIKPRNSNDLTQSLRSLHRFQKSEGLDVFHYPIAGTFCILGAFASLLASLWQGKPETTPEATSFVDFKESRFLSGSVYLSGSFTVVVDAEPRRRLRKSTESISSKTPNGYSESVESLFLDRNRLPDGTYLNPHLASLMTLDNLTPGSRKKWLTRPERGSKQSLSCASLQVQEVRLLNEDDFND